MICSSDRLSHYYYKTKQRAQHFFILCCALSETKGINYKNLKSQCVIPDQEHLPELAIMSDPLNTFDAMEWLKKVAMLFKCKLLRCSI